MEKNGVNLACTGGFELANEGRPADLRKQLHDGEKTCSSGAVALVVMGDGAASGWPI